MPGNKAQLVNRLPGAMDLEVVEFANLVYRL